MISFLFQDRICGNSTCNFGKTCETNRSMDIRHCVTTYCPEINHQSVPRVVGNMNHVGARRRYVCSVERSGGDATITPSTCLKNGNWSQINCLPFKVGRVNTLIQTSTSLLVHNVSIEECATRCVKAMYLCVFFNYNYGSNRSCVHEIGDKETSSTQQPGWVTFIKTFPIITLNNGINYNMTYEDGKQLCISKNTEIASRSDLNIALQMGYSNCRCAFVKERDVWIVMWYEWRWCYGRGITRCNIKYADVHCKNPDYTDPGLLDS